MVYSKSFKNEVSNHIGLLLGMFIFSPFLYKGYTIEYFKQTGKIPNDMDFAHM